MVIIHFKIDQFNVYVLATSEYLASFRTLEEAEDFIERNAVKNI